MTDQTHHYGDDCEPPHILMNEDGVPLASPFAELRAENDRLTAENERLREVLLYITSPTMALPGGKDAAEFALEGANEAMVRRALWTCIQLARQVLSDERPTP